MHQQCFSALYPKGKYGERGLWRVSKIARKEIKLPISNYFVTLPLENKVPFEKYQSIMKFLDDIGVEVIEPEQTTFSELTADDLKSIYLSKEQSRMGMVIDHSEVQREAMERRYCRK